MPRIPRTGAIALRALAVLTIGLAPARAGFVASVAETTTQSAGQYLYSYTVSVSSASTIGVAEFDVSVDPSANLGSINTNTSFFNLYTAGDSFVQFLSSGSTTDIAPGSSGVFSFTSALPPMSEPDLVRGYDATGAPFQIAGTTVAPVPEPASVALLGLGAVALAGGRFRRHRRGLLAVAASLAALALAPSPSRASDHADTAGNYDRIGADLTDLFIFPNPSNSANVVLVMDAHGLIPAGQGANIGFDPQVLYQFKIDNTGDYVEDLVLQFRFFGAAPNQRFLVAGPYKPATTGTTTLFARPHPVVGAINNTAGMTVANMKVFAGVRSEPFFFDLARFYKILPDRMTPLTGHQVNFPSIMAADTPQANGFRGFPPGSGYDSNPAMDYLADLNVLSIVAEMPKAMLGSGVIHVWMTTSLPTGPPSYEYQQQDRLARPVVNEALATVTDLRHHVNNMDNPTDDKAQLANDIRAFMNFPAGRSTAITNVLVSVLVPDTMAADLSQDVTTASYLGVETGGATGSKFGGRALVDDVVDISLGAIFGNTIPALGLAPDDGKELPQFTTDHVGPHDDYQNVFPYLGNPH